MIFILPAIWIISTIVIINNENLNADNNSDTVAMMCVVQSTSAWRGTNKIMYINVGDIFVRNIFGKPENLST